MRFPYKYIQIDGQWCTEDEDGYQRPARQESSLDVLVFAKYMLARQRDGK